MNNTDYDVIFYDFIKDLDIIDYAEIDPLEVTIIAAVRLGSITKEDCNNVVTLTYHLETRSDLHHDTRLLATAAQSLHDVWMMDREENIPDYVPMWAHEILNPTYEAIH